WDVTPDLLVLAKALGGGLPLGAFVGAPGLMRTLAHDPPLAHVTTFGGHPLSCAAGLAALDVLRRDGLVERGAPPGPRLVRGRATDAHRPRRSPRGTRARAPHRARVRRARGVRSLRAASVGSATDPQLDPPPGHGGAARPTARAARRRGDARGNGHRGGAGLTVVRDGQRTGPRYTVPRRKSASGTVTLKFHCCMSSGVWCMA